MGYVDPAVNPYIVEYVSGDYWQSEGFQTEEEANAFIERQGPDSRAHISIVNSELVNDQSTRVYSDPDQFLRGYLDADISHPRD